VIKYVPEMTSVVLEEIPDRVSLAVDISNCRGNCVGCHSPFLKQDIGEELTPGVIDSLVADNFGVNCFLFLGEGQDPGTLLDLARYARGKGLEAALYSGREEVEPAFWEVFDYIKLGPYRPECGPLNNPATNQRLYHVEKGLPKDITSRFWHRGLEPERDAVCAGRAK
jgi:anaerobic ribonucleoside-triphosphate reductase activating protein